MKCARCDKTIESDISQVFKKAYCRSCLIRKLKQIKIEQYRRENLDE